MKCFWALAACVCLLPAVALAQARAVDLAKSRIAFVYTIEKKFTVEGRFPEFAAQVVFDERAPERGSVNFTIDVAAIDTGSSEGDSEAKRPDWFDASKLATASFASRAIRRTGERAYEVDGRLKIKGIERDVTVPFTILPAQGGALRAQGRFVVKRLAFGIGTGAWADTDQIADAVELRFDLALGPPK